MPDGVTIDSEETEFCKCEWIQIQNESGAETMEQAVGNYVTIETNILEHGRAGDLDEIAETVLKMAESFSINESTIIVQTPVHSVVAMKT